MPGSEVCGGVSHNSDDDDEISDLPLPAWMEGDSLAPPCQADMDVVRAIIDFAGVTEDDVLYDLGCGDGRICIEAAESRGARACGVEIEEHLANKFRRRVAAKGLESKVSVVHGDLREVDLSDATVIVMYLLPEAISGIAQSHLLPLLRRGSRDRLAENSQEISAHTPSPKENLIVEKSTVEELQVHSGGDRSDCGLEGGGGGKGFACGEKQCRIVCNTWGIPGVTAVKEAGVGLYSGVKLRLFTHDSLPAGCDGAAVVA